MLFQENRHSETVAVIQAGIYRTMSQQRGAHILEIRFCGGKYVPNNETRNTGHHPREGAMNTGNV